MRHLEGTLSDNYIPLAELPLEERSRLWNAMTHLVETVATDPKSSELLAHIDFSLCPADTLALWRVMVTGSKEAVEQLADDQLRALKRAKPCDPVVQVTLDPVGSARYAKWGLRT